LGSDNITLVSGGVAMYLLLSVFPASTAAVSIYGLFATPADVVKHMQVFAGVLPPASGKSSARSCKCWRVTHRVA
jgi:membrane protein